MSYEKVNQAKRIVVGTKQTLKLLESGNVAEVLVAEDADPKVTAKVIQLCEKARITVTYVDSMRKLGKAAGIDVGAAVVSLLKE